MATVIDDDVWRKLDPSTGRLKRRTRLRVTVALALALATLIVAGYVHSSGLFSPRLTLFHSDSAYEYPDGSDWLIFNDSTQRTTRVRQALIVENNGWYALTIVGADRDRPGMRVTQVTIGDIHLEGNTWRTGGRPLTPGAPYRLEPGASVSIQVHYDITDCRAVPPTPEPIPLRVIGPLGARTVDVPVPPLNVSDGGWQVSDPSDPDAVQWQRYLADRVCAVNG
jgi:hypothetical protein